MSGFQPSLLLIRIIYPRLYLGLKYVSLSGFKSIQSKLFDKNNKTKISDFPHSLYFYPYICHEIKSIINTKLFIWKHFYSGRLIEQMLKIEFTTVKMFWNEKRVLFTSKTRAYIPWKTRLAAWALKTLHWKDIHFGKRSFAVWMTNK